jgi:hypothetical protein
MFEADEAGAEAVVDELSSPYCGEARTDVASTPKMTVVEESMECIFGCCLLLLEVGGLKRQSPGSKYLIEVESK